MNAPLPHTEYTPPSKPPRWSLTALGPSTFSGNSPSDQRTELGYHAHPAPAPRLYAPEIAFGTPAARIAACASCSSALLSIRAIPSPTLAQNDTADAKSSAEAETRYQTAPVVFNAGGGDGCRAGDGSGAGAR